MADREGNTRPSPTVEPDAPPSENTVAEDPLRKRMHSFYFVKMNLHEDPNLPAAEKLVPKLNQERVLIHEKRSEKMTYRDNLRWVQRHGSGSMDQHWDRDKMKFLQLCLDKVQFANNSSRGRAIKPSSCLKEIDHHSLHFGLIHGSKKLSKEKQILRKIKDTEKIVDECNSLEDYGRKIDATWPMLYENIFPSYKQRRLEEAEKLKQQKEEAIVGAALNGKMWGSLGSKQNLIQQIQSIRVQLDNRKVEFMKFSARVAFLNKELVIVEKHLSSLEKQSISIGRLRDEVAERIPQWQKQQQEKNACYDSYIELKRHAKELAEKKEVVAVQKLCHQEVEKFMSRWDNDKCFRDDYRTRSVLSLNKRCLAADGRRRNCGEKPIDVKPPGTEISKSLKRAFQNMEMEDF